MPLITIDPTALTVAERNRALAQFGKYLQLKDAQGNPRNATGAEIRADIARYVRSVIVGTEDEGRKNALPPLDFDATV